jgi:hypothetical protein
MKGHLKLAALAVFAAAGAASGATAQELTGEITRLGLEL